MKLKLYLRMVLATMVALFVATGCSSSSTEEPPTGPIEESLTFEIQVSDVATGTATLAVKPSKATSTYYCGAIVKAEFDAFATEEAFFAAETKRIEAAAAAEKMTLQAYLQMYSYRGEGNRTVTTTVPETPYYAYVYGIKGDGSATSKVFKTEFTSADVPPPAAEPGLEIVSMKAGTNTGTMKDTRIYMVAEITGTPAVSGLYGMFQTSYVETQLAGGATYETIVADATPMDAQFLEYIHDDGGIGLTFGTAAAPLTPETSYTVILLATSAEGGTIVKHQSASTEATSGGGGTGPTVTVTLAAGQYMQDGSIGGDPTTQLHIIVESAPMNVTAGKTYINETSIVQEALAGGYTYESLVAEFGADLTADRIGIINDGGLVLNYKAGAFTPGTSYTAIALLTNPSGTSAGHAAASTTGGGGGTGDLTFTFSVTNITATTATVQVTPSNNSDAYFFDVQQKAVVDQIGSDSNLIAALKEAYGADFESLMSKGADDMDATKLTANTDYCVLAFGYANGAATTAVSKYTFRTTGGGDGTATEAYKAWLGTWTLTSTSSEVTKSPISFDVTFSQKAANSTYSIAGWGITLVREDSSTAPVAKFDGATGKFQIMNDQEFIVDPSDNSVLTLVGRALLQGKYYIINGDYPGFTGTLNADKNSASITLYQGEITSMGTFITSSLDFFWFEPGENGKIYSNKPAAGYTANDYPIGPYTMTKKSGAAAPAKSMGVNSPLRAVTANKSMVMAVREKSMYVKSAVVASNIPQLSSMLKTSLKKSMSFTSTGLEAKFQQAEFSPVATGSESKTVMSSYEAVRMQ